VKTGKARAVLSRIHPNAGADSDAAENGFGGVLASRVSRRSATQPRRRRQENRQPAWIDNDTPKD